MRSSAIAAQHCLNLPACCKLCLPALGERLLEGLIPVVGVAHREFINFTILPPLITVNPNI